MFYLIHIAMCINYGQKNPWGGDEWFSYEKFTIMGLPFSILASIMKNILGEVSLANFLDIPAARPSLEHPIIYDFYINSNKKR